jgi:hypothetical protein
VDFLIAYNNLVAPNMQNSNLRMKKVVSLAIKLFKIMPEKMVQDFKSYEEVRFKLFV